MLRLLAIYFAVTTLIDAKTCPTGYSLVGGDRCIRPLDNGLYVQGNLSSLLPGMMSQCEKEGGFLPIVRNAQDNTMFNNFAAGVVKKDFIFIVLGMVCNTKTKRLEWEDGTKIAYIQPPQPQFNPVNLTFDCVEYSQHVVSRVNTSDWLLVPDLNTYSYTFLCETKATGTGTADLDEQCGEFDKMTTNVVDLNKPCIKVYTESVGWREAELKCTQDFAMLASILSDGENSYIRRSAVGMGMVGGIHIGLKASEGSPDFAWVDGEKMNYDNFGVPFPVAGGGECAAMITDRPEGYWMNVDCDAESLPYVCRRPVFPSTTCPTKPPKANEQFFAPGFPHPDIPCEYMLTVEAESLVELEVLALEANVGSDYLEVFEGASGVPLANLTGTTPAPPDNIIRTVSANVMRLNWKPNGAVGVRGFMLSYQPVTKSP
ncbi:hypothetical protein PENTCL1PPCAC_20254 [Pristionchus entomophagus]|uniref:CUB domain-containing protein n=1 Tax=Pristionchus entomophagus TaxID=358040 RepID=A0AAV5TVR3_9BILA|nr:hypothetical protein PENTCL1PPCAC_20254 [Pristionchus entomophagus]